MDKSARMVEPMGTQVCTLSTSHKYPPVHEIDEEV